MKTWLKVLPGNILPSLMMWWEDFHKATHEEKVLLHEELFWKICPNENPKLNQLGGYNPKLVVFQKQIDEQIKLCSEVIYPEAVSVVVNCLSKEWNLNKNDRRYLEMLLDSFASVITVIEENPNADPNENIEFKKCINELTEYILVNEIYKIARLKGFVKT